MQALLFKLGARTSVERVASLKDHETARAIPEGRIPGTSLNVEEPTLTASLVGTPFRTPNRSRKLVISFARHVPRQSYDDGANGDVVHVTCHDGCFAGQCACFDHGITSDGDD